MQFRDPLLIALGQDFHCVRFYRHGLIRRFRISFPYFRCLWKAILIGQKGGTFYCLEFSKPKNSIVNSIYKKFKSNIIPYIGAKITKNKEAYKYLDESIDLFLDQDELLANLKQIGFKENSYLNMFNGIVSIHTGFKI